MFPLKEEKTHAMFSLIWLVWLAFDRSPKDFLIIEVCYNEANWFATETNAWISDPWEWANQRNPVLEEDLTDLGDPSGQ